MNKAIVVNESSIIDLKVELFRKEESFKQQQNHVNASKDGVKTKGSKTLKKLAILTGKKKLGKKRKLQTTPTINEHKQTDNSHYDAEYEKSKLHLQSKEKLYEKMIKGEIEDPENEEGETNFLVDFHKKVYDKVYNKLGDKSEDSGEEWVEFEDSLGRQRKCMKKDLEQFKSLDVEFRPVNRSPSPPTLSSEDMHREMLRKKWEKETEEMLQNPEKDIHYQNILFDEVREHGVGYYQFSKDEAERKSQIEALNQLREQTIDQRTKRENLKKKREAALQSRLMKIKQKRLDKKNLQEGKEIGLLVEDDKETNTETNSSTLYSETGISPEVESTGEQGESRIPLPLNSANEVSTGASNTESLNKATDEKMVAKGKKWSYTTWINAQREERNPDFAPPTIYQNEQFNRGRRKGRGTAFSQ